MITRSALRRLGILIAAMATLIGLGAVPAFAHVTVHPDHAEQGGFTKLTFRVPNEESDAKTTKLQITLPTDPPIPFVSVKPHPGWSYHVKTITLDKPVKAEGTTISHAVSQITWTANHPSAAIAPGEFDEFAVSIGPLPDKATTLHFPAIQTYSNGDVVRWIEVAAPGAPEPDHPAPSLTLAPAVSETAATRTSTQALATPDDTDSGSTAAIVLSIIAIVIAVLAVAGAGLSTIRRQRGQ